MTNLAKCFINNLLKMVKSHKILYWKSTNSIVTEHNISVKECSIYYLLDNQPCYIYVEDLEKSELCELKYDFCTLTDIEIFI